MSDLTFHPISGLPFVAFFLLSILLVVCVRVLFGFYSRLKSSPAKLAAKLGFLVLFALLYALLLAYFLASFSMLAAYCPALIAGLVVLFVQAFLLMIQYLTQSKRSLTERQKSELMDL